MGGQSGTKGGLCGTHTEELKDRKGTVELEWIFLCITGTGKAGLVAEDAPHLELAGPGEEGKAAKAVLAVRGAEALPRQGPVQLPLARLGLSLMRMASMC